MAVLDVHTDHFELHRIPIPIFCDNSYQAELYVAWVVLRARASARWFVRDERWSLTDSNSYITALGSRNVTSLLVACRSLVKNTAPPQHLYSHLTGTFLDCVMDAVDNLAREVGMSQTPRYGWIPELQVLPVLFTHDERQVQDFQAFLNKKIPACVLHHLQVPFHPPSPSLLLYERVVMTGAIKWGVHLRTVAIRQGLYNPPAVTTCCMCGATVTPRHYTRDCPLLDLFRIAIHAQLAMAISQLVPRWSVNRVTLSGAQVFYGNSLFGIRVGPAALSGPMAYPCANIGFTGEITPADEKLLLSRGITCNALRHTLGFVLHTVVAIHTKHCLPAVPSLPDFCTQISTNERMSLSWIEPNPEEVLPSSWSVTAPTAIQWPHPAILRWVASVFTISMSMPRFITGVGITQHPPTQSLYWFSAAPLQGRTPPPHFTVIHECMFDLPQPDLPPYSLHGRVVWSMEYGYPSRHLSLWLDAQLHMEHRQAALRLVMQRALSLVGLLPRHSGHYGGSP